MNENTAKVLVVDDEEVVRRSYLRILANAPFDVCAAWDGMQALKAMESEPFDVVLLDLRMPGMDGIEVLKAIKARWPESEVVVITGYPSIGTAKEAVNLGAYDYLAKPVGPAEVLDAASAAARHKKWALRREARPAQPAQQPGAIS
jgi:DNA-binding NtrC family response regulator